MDAANLEFDISTTNADIALGVKVLVDHTVVYNNPHVTESYHFSHAFSDDDGEHELSIELYGKLPEHTKMSDTGDIAQDALITINNIKVDDIDISQISSDLIEYHHDFNGTQSAITDKFYGAMGCNGIARLKFTTPVYLWLLENL
jgi:hypothetical protein